ncbi:MAG: preprotein translocase subunit SecE [Oscillospiraceae bacterium]|nr:preprotein translocase subunit SecE [Oscillospiraceae bacterium]
MAEIEEKDDVELELEEEETDSKDSTDSKESKKEKAVKKADGSKPAKKKKFGLFNKIAKFFREYKSELKKIVWYGRNATIKSTILVVCVIVIAAAVIGALDFVFSNILLSLGRLM